MTTLAQYSAARAALAEAARVDQVMHVRDEVEHLQLYARQIKDRTLMADALELQLRCERRLGQLLVAAKEAGQVSRGAPKKNCTGEEQFPRVRLDDAGIDRKLSSKAQKAARLSEKAFAAMVEQAKNKLAGTAAKVVSKATSIPKKQEPAPAQDPAELQHDPAPDWHQQCLSAIGAIKQLVVTAPDIGSAAWLKHLIANIVPAGNQVSELIDPETGEIVDEKNSPINSVIFRARAANIRLANDGGAEQSSSKASPDTSTAGSGSPRARGGRPTEEETTHAEEPAAPEGKVCQPSNAPIPSRPSSDTTFGNDSWPIMPSFLVRRQAAS